MGKYDDVFYDLNDFYDFNGFNDLTNRLFD
jgi:hypothetical protein